MKKIYQLLLALSVVAFLSCGGDEGGGGTDPEPTGIDIPSSGFTSPTSYSGYTLAWEDDFSGTSLNSNNWTHETGNGTNGWGNFELQTYQPENTTMQDGHLIITAKEQTVGGFNYTSSRIISQNKYQFRYGRVDIRAALPQGKGMWPALWALGSNFSTVGWPACGEIDIMEKVGGAGLENEIHGTVHWQHDGQAANFGGSKNLSTNTTDQFHVYSIVWTPNSISWYIDGDTTPYHEINTSPASGAEQLDEFRRSFFFIMNLAVGGTWPGSPDATTTFPQHLIVDYIRVFEQD